MYFTTILLAIASLAVTAVNAAPSPRTNVTTANIGVLNYALALERLEAEFFKQGIAKFNASAFSDAGYKGPIRSRIMSIAEQENSHVAVLSNAITKLKGQPVPACNYTFPLDNVTTFVVVAQALENTGVSAYLGALSGLRGGVVTTAASIAAVEARHASYLNELRNQTGLPYARDTALTPAEVATLASSFIQSCPYNMTLTPFTSLNASLPANGTGMVTTSFAGPKSNDTSSQFCQFLYGPKTVVSPRANCTLPNDVIGYVFVLVTDSKIPITSKNQKSIVAGPALLFNVYHNNTSPSTNTTTTMSPSMSPTMSSSMSPSMSPSMSSSMSPSMSPSVSPSVSPTVSMSPTMTPTASPTS